MVNLKKTLQKLFYIIMKKYWPLNNSLLIFSLNDSFITEKMLICALRKSRPKFYSMLSDEIIFYMPVNAFFILTFCLIKGSIDKSTSFYM